MVDRSVGVILGPTLFWAHKIMPANPRALAGALATSIAYQGVRDVARSIYRTGRSMVFRKRTMGYGGYSGSRYRSRYRYRRPRRSRYRKRYYRRRLAKRARIGMPVGYGTTKRNLVVNESALNRDSRELYSHDLTWITKDTTNALNLRQRDIINLRGFKIDWAMRSGATTSFPLYMNFAILAHASNTSVPTSTRTQCIVDENFFRGNSASRAIDFGTSLESIQMTRLNINQDIYSVLRRWRVRMDPVVNPTGITSRFVDITKAGKKYIPVRRQVRYDDATNGQVATSGRMFLVYWCDGVQGRPSGATGIAAALNIDLHVVVYFNEPSGC